MQRYRTRTPCLAMIFLVLAGLGAPAGEAPAGAPAEPPADSIWEPPAGLPPGWYASIETTMGDVLARLLPEQAPQSVAHFVGLAQGTLPWVDAVTGETITEPYFDGMLIQSVMAGRFFETADGASMGRGTPVVFVPEDEGAGPVNFFSPYVLGLTRLPGGRVGAAKFFVTVAAQPWLNGESPCFGSVIEGRETVYNISQLKTYSNHRPIEDVRIDRVRVFAVGDAPALAEPRPYTPQRKEVMSNDDLKPTPR